MLGLLHSVLHLVLYFQKYCHLKMTHTHTNVTKQVGENCVYNIILKYIADMISVYQNYFHIFGAAGSQPGYTLCQMSRDFTTLKQGYSFFLITYSI